MTCNIFRIFNRIMVSSVVPKRCLGSYKYIRRPDPKTVKMPNVGSAPGIMTIIKEKIRLTGPITVADYMNIILTNPAEGYYMKKEVIGQSGDFITSPEISQLFGEIVAVWFYSETQKMGTGKPLQLVELGPGYGTLMIDCLRVLHRFGYKPSDLSMHLVEISPTMQQIQANRLCASHRSTDINYPYYYEGETISGIKIFWYDDLKKVPTNFSWYIAHEFFDVLPIHKFTKTENGWREVLIDIDNNGNLQYRISDKATQAVHKFVRPPLDDEIRTHLEVSARSLSIASQLAERIDSDGGIAWIADYGHEGEKQDTFRAFYKHHVVDPLEMAGKCDLTADVDFSQLRIAATKTSRSDNYAIVAGPVTQKQFLERLQANIRLQILVDGAKTENDKEILKSGYEMLTNPQKMGERFKIMAFYPSSTQQILEKYPPLGFSAL